MRPRGKRTHRHSSYSRQRHAYYPRRWHWYPRRAWRPRHRLRRQVIRTKRPKKTYTVYIRGYEPLGVIGSYVDFGNAKAHWVVNNHWKASIFENYLDKSKTAQYKDFVGGWGNAQWTLDGLLSRIRKGFAEISMNISSFTSCKLVNITLYGIPLRDHEWVLTGQTHFSSDEKDYKNIQYWVHPLHLMLTPGRLYVPTFQKKQKTFWKRKFYPPYEMSSEWFDKHYFDTVLLFKYQWSVVELRNVMGFPEDAENYKDIVDNTEWFKQTTDDKWKHSCFDKTANDQGNTIWNQIKSAFFGNVWTSLKSLYSGKKTRNSPMFPPFYLNTAYETAGFFYRVKLLFTGHSFQTTTPGDVIEVANPNCAGGANTSADLNSSDISEGGTISPRAFRRIIGADIHHRMESSEQEETTEEEEEKGDPIYARICRHLEEIYRNATPGGV